MQRRALLLGGLIYGLLLMGLITLRGELLALAIPLLLYLSAGLLYGPAPLRLAIARHLSTDRTTPEAPVTVTLTITNEGEPLEQLLLEDLVPPPLRVVEGEPQRLTSLPAGATCELRYTVAGPRGYYLFPGLQVGASDHLGLFQRRTLLPAPGRLLVLPTPLKLRQVPIRPWRTRVYAGFIPARRGGPGVEFFSVRSYQPGDPLRWINWKAGARHPRALFTNEFRQERIADVGVILDARRRRYVRRGEESLFEYAIQAATALAEALLNDGNRVGLLLYGRFVDWTFPGYGKVQRERIFQALARAEMGESLVFEKLEYLPTRLFPPHSQLVLVSPLAQEDLPTLIQLRARGYSLLVVSPDPIAFEVEAMADRPEVRLATRIARLERALLFRQLRQAGIGVLDWPVDQPFDRTVHATLSRRSLWVRGGPQIVGRAPATLR